MDDGELVIRWTVRLAMVCYTIVLAVAIANRQAPATSSTSRWIWTVGCALFVAHVLFAFAFYHHWSHQHAFEDTKAKTLAAVGLAFGWGIYVNHLFSLLWIGDVAWSWLGPQSYGRRPVWVIGLFHAFMLFIAINGLMVFKDGATRWISFAVGMVLLAWWIVTLVSGRSTARRRYPPGAKNDSVP